jgi:hypothetical protein
VPALRSGCPTGAISKAGAFDFSACTTHTYREFLSGFGDWVETVADAGGAAGYRAKVTDAETVSVWQSLAFGPQYKAAYCVSVCPAGEDVMSRSSRATAQHTLAAATADGRLVAPARRTTRRG